MVEDAPDDAVALGFTPPNKELEDGLAENDAPPNTPDEVEVGRMSELNSVDEEWGPYDAVADVLEPLLPLPEPD